MMEVITSGLFPVMSAMYFGTTTYVPTLIWIDSITLLEASMPPGVRAQDYTLWGGNFQE